MDQTNHNIGPKSIEAYESIDQGMEPSKFHRFKLRSLEVLKEIRVEPFMLFLQLSVAVSGITIQQLIQDKLCIQKYHQSVEFCRNLGTSEDSPEKSKILSSLVTFNMIQTILDSLPGIIWALMIGSLCDNYINGRKIIMFLASLSGLIKNFLLIMNTFYFNDWSLEVLMVCLVPPNFIGTFAAGLTAIYSFITCNTSESTRALRFLILECVQIFCISIGPLVGSIVLDMDPLFSGQDIDSPVAKKYNYEGVFMISCLLDACGCLWILFALKESRPQVVEIVERTATDTEQSSMTTTTILSSIELASNPTLTESSSLRSGKETFKRSPSLCTNVCRPILSIFRPIQELFRTLFKVRSDSGRSKLLLLLFLYVTINISFNGLAKILFSIIQRLYNWDAIIWSRVSTIGFMISPIEMVILVPLLTRYYKFSDSELAIFGSISAVIGYTVMGSIISPLGLWLNFILGSMTLAALIATRSLLSKSVGPGEATKVFSIITIFDVLLPLTATTVYGGIFNLTIDVYPTAVFHVSAFFDLIALIGYTFLDLKYYYKVNKRSSDP